MKTIKTLLLWIFLYLLFIALFIAGSLAVAGHMPEGVVTEPGLVPAGAGLLIIALVNVAVIGALILSLHWRGWQLALSLAVAFYGTTTFLMQIETWFFLSQISVELSLVPRLFIMGLPTAFIFIPLAVWLLGRGKQSTEPQHGFTYNLAMPATQWFYKLVFLAVAYVVLYWLAGYFIAWQNPELRAFYGHPGDALPFFIHTAVSLAQEPELFLLQFVRGLLWVACALLIIRASAVSPVYTALLVGALFSLPQNVGHILANPLMPFASVRFSHMIETAISTFVFGLLVVWLLHRRHYSLRDLF